MKSNKPSTTFGISSAQLKANYTFFLDNDQGAKIMVDILRRSGLKVEIHKDHFAPEEKDHVWMPQCAQRGWIIVSSDKGLETVDENRAALIDCKAKVIILEENNSKGIVWASAIVVSAECLLRMAHDNDGPFVVNLAKETHHLATKFRKVTTAVVVREKRTVKQKTLAS